MRSSRPPGRASGFEHTEEPRSGAHGVICPEPVQEPRVEGASSLGVRDTVPVPSGVPAPAGADASSAGHEAKESGARRRVTIAVGAGPEPALAVTPTEALAVAPAAAPAVTPAAFQAPAAPPSVPTGSASRGSAPVRGRYSSQPSQDELVSGSSPPASVAGRGRYSSQSSEENVSPSPSPPPASSRDTIRRPARQALRVDEVGPTRLVARHEASAASKPRRVQGKSIAGTSLAAREAFVLSLVDGALSVEDLSDAAGIPESEVKVILARLVQLGIVAS